MHKGKERRVLPGVFPQTETQHVLIPAGFSPTQRAPGWCSFHMAHLSDEVNTVAHTTHASSTILFSSAIETRIQDRL